MFWKRCHPFAAWCQILIWPLCAVSPQKFMQRVKVKEESKVAMETVQAIDLVSYYWPRKREKNELHFRRRKAFHNEFGTSTNIFIDYIGSPTLHSGRLIARNKRS